MHAQLAAIEVTVFNLKIKAVASILDITYTITNVVKKIALKKFINIKFFIF